MILIDSSAWIEFLRDTGSPACLYVDALLGAEFATCEPVWMEILAGARDERHLSELRRLLAGATLLATTSIDYEEAAALYRICRRDGETPRKLVDCLIAAIAIRADVAVLHLDADFDVLSRHTSLKIDDGS
ncbi:MAG TPA: PIN domain nuclease [Acidimicrobiales bacterium]|nr:PIN domain nuclease [Acidimicrobiales bacterium]